MRAKEGGKETTGETALRLPSVPFPWSLAVHHQSLAFRARLCHAKNEAPEEEAGLITYLAMGLNIFRAKIDLAQEKPVLSITFME